MRTLVFPLLDPLVDISGERIGCEDPDDDHILELAINAKARFIVARDHDILNLPRVARKRLDDSGVTVMRADVFCAFIREFVLLTDPGVKPLIVALVVEMTQAWLAKSEPERRAWLNDKLALANEYMMWPNGIFANSTLEANQLLPFWNVTNQESTDGLVALLQSDDARQYFVVKSAQGGQYVRTQEPANAALGAFCSKLTGVPPGGMARARA